jgi:hypothetical protein
MSQHFTTILLALCLAVGSVFATPAKAAGILTVKVVDASVTPDTPIEGASVSVKLNGDPVDSGTTNEAGEFTFTGEAGSSYTVAASAEYYLDGEKVWPLFGVVCTVPLTPWVHDPPLPNEFWYNRAMHLYYESNSRFYFAEVYNANCKITTANPHFVADHGRANDEPPVLLPHFHLRFDYGAANTGLDWWPSVAQGNAFWDWAYHGIGTRGALDCTVAFNCITYAFDGTVNGISLKCWVDPDDWSHMDSSMAKLRSRMASIVYEGPSLDALNLSVRPVLAGDRAVAAEHAWVILEGDGSGPAGAISWKNNCSPEYIWTHDEDAFNCSLGFAYKLKPGATEENRDPPIRYTIVQLDGETSLFMYKRAEIWRP